MFFLLKNYPFFSCYPDFLRTYFPSLTSLIFICIYFFAICSLFCLIFIVPQRQIFYPYFYYWFPPPLPGSLILVEYTYTVFNFKSFKCFIYFWYWFKFPDRTLMTVPSASLMLWNTSQRRFIDRRYPSSPPARISSLSIEGYY